MGSKICHVSSSERSLLTTYVDKNMHNLTRGGACGWHKDKFYIPTGCVGYVNENKRSAGWQYTKPGRVYQVRIDC